MFTKKIRIQYVDTDASQRIHYSSIFRHLEIIDYEFFRHIGYPYKKLFELGYELPRVHVECSYMEMIEYDEMLEAQVYITKIGNTSFTYLFHFLNEKGKIVVKAGMTIVFIQKITNQKVSIPDFIRNELEKHIGFTA